MLLALRALVALLVLFAPALALRWSVEIVASDPLIAGPLLMQRASLHVGGRLHVVHAGGISSRARVSHVVGTLRCWWFSVVGRTGGLTERCAVNEDLSVTVTNRNFNGRYFQVRLVALCRVCAQASRRTTGHWRLCAWKRSRVVRVGRGHGH